MSTVGLGPFMLNMQLFDMFSFLFEMLLYSQSSQNVNLPGLQKLKENKLLYRCHAVPNLKKNHSLVRGHFYYLKLLLFCEKKVFKMKLKYIYTQSALVQE